MGGYQEGKEKGTGEVRPVLCAVLLLLTGCRHPGPRKFSELERLRIWQAVVISATFARQTSEVIKFETGKDTFGEIYDEQLAPTLKRYGIDRLAAVLIFEEEGGWPYNTHNCSL